MVKKCKYYLDIHKNECALRKLHEFHVLKAFKLPNCLHVVIIDVHTRMSPVSWSCSKQRPGTPQHAIICMATSLSQKVECFIDLELIIFLVQLGCYGYGSHCKVLCYANMQCSRIFLVFNFPRESCHHKFTFHEWKFTFPNFGMNICQQKTSVFQCMHSCALRISSTNCPILLLTR